MIRDDRKFAKKITCLLKCGLYRQVHVDSIVCNWFRITQRLITFSGFVLAQKVGSWLQSVYCEKERNRSEHVNNEPHVVNAGLDEWERDSTFWEVIGDIDSKEDEDMQDTTLLLKPPELLTFTNDYVRVLNERATRMSKTIDTVGYAVSVVFGDQLVNWNLCMQRGYTDQEDSVRHEIHTESKIIA